MRDAPWVMVAPGYRDHARSCWASTWSVTVCGTRSTRPAGEGAMTAAAARSSSRSRAVGRLWRGRGPARRVAARGARRRARAGRRVGLRQDDAWPRDPRPAARGGARRGTILFEGEDLAGCRSAEGGCSATASRRAAIRRWHRSTRLPDRRPDDRRPLRPPGARRARTGTRAPVDGSGRSALSATSDGCAPTRTSSPAACAAGRDRDRLRCAGVDHRRRADVRPRRHASRRRSWRLLGR